MSEEQIHEPKNPLITLWNLLGSVGGVISLSSLVQNCFDDLLRWRGFISDVVESYRSIVAPIFDFLFGWMVGPPDWLVDYIVVGLLLFISLERGLGTAPDSSLKAELLAEGYTPSELRKFRKDHTYFQHPLAAFLELLARRFMLALIQSPFWPIYLIIACSWLLRFGSSYKERRSELLRGAQWFGAIVLGLTVLLAVNSQL